MKKCSKIRNIRLAMQRYHQKKAKKKSNDFRSDFASAKNLYF